ncbi:hypothetical protein B4096_3307 [Heyndrickxia coagulans]|uniref:Uncharacterized protein n=1 Tax=Heyndrickxia coagulans TaxID=1398 RepID=A0AAN0T6V4_HEYCO|nr:hypothetical protein SB48_HM08orf03388 [Heyndrickxia coagulans]KYC61252.1 hypothetical protein B4100_3352 [Heyndrickxia coagulans]KYC79240.1 hypothetical protein B4096_3307 [Heyndrickxia coagulans]
MRRTLHLGPKRQKAENTGPPFKRCARFMIGRGFALAETVSGVPSV